MKRSFEFGAHKFYFVGNAEFGETGAGAVFVILARISCILEFGEPYRVWDTDGPLFALVPE
jgi:hypothetical protein